MLKEYWNDRIYLNEDRSLDRDRRFSGDGKRNTNKKHKTVDFMVAFREIGEPFFKKNSML